MKKVVFDIDGVLIDFQSKTEEELGYYPIFDSDFRTEEDRIYFKKVLLNSPEFYSEMDFIPEGLKIYRYLMKKGYEIHIVTSRRNSVSSVTINQLKKANLRFQSIKFTSNKVPHVKELSRGLEYIYIFEDMPYNIEKYIENIDNSIIFTPYYKFNKGLPVIYYNTLEDIKEFF